MSRQARNQGAAMPTATTRQNEYFVPRDGIDREVISADICRYLGNDALVRPGVYENPSTGQTSQGYFITAYRNLTTAMIEDLKADSARWDSERRAQSSRNTSGVQYRYSETHQSRQHHGPTEAPFPSDPYARDAPFDGPRYPGSGAPGYSGASGGYPAQSQQQFPPASSGAYGYQQQPQQSPPPDPRYGGAQPRSAQPIGGQHMNPGFSQEPPYVSTGTNLNMSRGGFPPPSDPYSSSRMSTTGAAQPSTYATAPPTQPGYPAPAQSYQYNQAPPTGAQSYANMPQDAFYGRASPAGQSAPQQQQGYSTQGQPQYEEAPRPRPSTSTPSAPAASSGSSNRRSDRDSDRHASDRHHRSSRR